MYFDGEYSTSRHTSSGVPQGSILSPVLCNMMMSDLPSELGVTTSEYADDITIYSVSTYVQEATRRLQNLVNKIIQWIKHWGLQQNCDKTKAMIFTRKHVHPLSLSMNNVDIEFVPSHKFLGMMLDSPGLTLKNHVNSVKSACLPKINLLRSISHHHWGADRKMLLKFYVLLVRSRLDYGSIFYDTVSDTHIGMLNVVKNTCLRMVIGARKTSPISSLEVESFIHPLCLHRKETIIKY